MAGKLRFGILGTGNIANQFAQGVAGSDRAVCTAVGSRAESTAEAFGHKHSIERRHASYDALLEDDQVDAVYISLPNSMHASWTIKALEAGKHVLCEKPLAVTADEAESMFAASDRAGRLLVEAFMYRSHPMMQRAVERVRSGEIGDVRLIKASFCYCTKTIDGNVRFDADLAGGALMDIGCYCIDFARLMADAEPEDMRVTGVLHETGVDLNVAGAMRFPGGVLASFACGMGVQTDNAAMVCGTKGYLTIPIPWKPPVSGAQLILDGMTPPKQDGGGAKPSRQVLSIDAGKPLYGLEADDFAAAVQDGVSPRVTRVDSLANARILDTLRRQLGLRF